MATIFVSRTVSEQVSSESLLPLGTAFQGLAILYQATVNRSYLTALVPNYLAPNGTDQLMPGCWARTGPRSTYFHCIYDLSLNKIYFDYDRILSVT